MAIDASNLQRQKGPCCWSVLLWVEVGAHAVRKRPGNDKKQLNMPLSYIVLAVWVFSAVSLYGFGELKLKLARRA
jgi:hypothetical protein